MCFRAIIHTTKGPGSPGKERKKTMRFIDKTGCKSALERGKDSDIKKMGALTRTATRIAEQNKLGVMKTRQGCYRVIREGGIGAYEDFLDTLAEVDDFLKHLDDHKATRYY